MYHSKHKESNFCNCCLRHSEALCSRNSLSPVLITCTSISNTKQRSSRQSPPAVGLEPDAVQKALSFHNILIMLNIKTQSPCFFFFFLPSSIIFWGTVKQKSLQIWKIFAVKMMWCNFFIWHFKHYNLLGQTSITLAFYFLRKIIGRTGQQLLGRNKRYSPHPPVLMMKKKKLPVLFGPITSLWVCVISTWGLILIWEAAYHLI